jgi:hypothetical protein
MTLLHRKPSLAAFPLLATIAIGLAGCASSSGTKVSATTPEGNAVTTYDDPTHGIRLTYPGDWEEITLMRPKGTVLLLAPPASNHAGLMPPAFAVVSPESERPVSADDLDGMQQRTIDKAKKEIGEFQLVQSDQATVGGEPARRIVYTGKKLGQSLEVMYVLTTHAGKPYAFSFMSGPDVFESVRPGADKVVESVQWISGTTTDTRR